MTQKENEKGTHTVITMDRGDVFVDDGFETFNDAVDAMMHAGDMLTVQERVTIAKRDYRDITGADYMTVVGYYDEETWESEESMTLVEAITRREEIEDQELEEDF